MARVTFAEFARVRGVSRPTVTQAVQEGRVTAFIDANGERFLDDVTSMAEWDKNTKRKRPPEQPATEAQMSAIDAEPAGAKPTNVPLKSQSEAISAAFIARMRKLDYEERLGTLVPIAKVRDDNFKIYRAVRDNLETMPDRVSSEFAAETDAFKINRRLRAEIRRILEDLNREYGSEQ